MNILVMILTLLVIFSTLHSSYGVPEFSYNLNLKHMDFGWQGKCKEGQNQSPVNIDKSSLKSEKKEAYFDNYNKYISGNITHEHHTVKFTFNNTQDVHFVSDKKVEYRLQSMHFHWGCTEHSIDNKSYSMELHLVHFNPKLGSFDTVEQYKSQGLSVVGVLFEESSHDNEVLNDVLKMIDEHSTRNNKKITYRDLLPAKLKHVYQYKGSLTTPPCYESVLWHVLDTRPTISLNQIIKFKKLNPYAYFPNCRLLKPLNGRKITSVKVSESLAYSFTLKSSLFTQIWILIGLMFMWKHLLT